MLDARRGEVFTDGPRVCKPEELDVAGLTLVGDGAIRYRTLFEERGSDDPARTTTTRTCPIRCCSSSAPAPFGAAELVEPLYVRDPDAKPQP